ncbi:Condensin-2 complex subunit H2 [Frankliniella fusca]|uniref:Condensin-2 complex subunit H2 n=1 Tax=Frankliniella fusca TaxID=407009 RepID=A0AAE1HTD3_9NEOP|nr:Condensin-2 complex subunit H2 [Frankliniella fusca]
MNKNTMDVLNTHLPKILDLASNFNLDLSGVLAGYAQKLRDDVPELMENFSFPEAALLLQHCAEIYGRKVDYVHNLALELCENMNSRIYAPESAQGPETTETTPISPKKLGRKKRTVSAISTEDFKMNSFPLEKPNIFNRGRKKKKKKHCAEAVCVRLAAVNLPSHEYHIYDDDTTSIGTKDQFRLNWPLEQNCRLEEYILDEGSGNLWNVCDVGVSNMPTPEYSDDGARCPTPLDHISRTSPGPSINKECGSNLDCNEISESNEIPNISTGPDNDSALDCNERSDSCQMQEQSVSSDITTAIASLESASQEKEKIIDNVANDQIKEKPKTSKTTFKLPFELTKKGSKGSKPEGNITLFLFSDMLKRSLGMKGPLPPMSRHKNGDNKLVEKHVAFLKKKYSLERKVLDTRSLLEEQSDFLGFEEEVLPDIPDVLTALESSDTQKKANLKPNVKTLDRVVNLIDQEDHDDHWDADLSSHDNTEFQEEIHHAQRPTVDEQGVRNWRQFIQGKLAAEEEQRPFDVHSYGSDIINSFRHVGETLSFEEIVGGMDVREIGRFFVSSLMLANTTNLKLNHSGQPNSLSMTLEKTERYHDMEDILVPPAAGGIKRKSHSNLEEEEESVQQRHQKQIPGKGPWKNKSKKGQ